jgi:hypothetical protein
MKKLMTLMLGLSLFVGSVTVMFGQDEPKKEATGKKGKKKMKGKKKKGGEETKKE